MTVDDRRLGSTDYELSPIGLGCIQFTGRGITSRVYPALDQPTVNAIVRAALDGGVNWFDTAEMYGKGQSERALTTALREGGVDPGKVVVATKWPPALRTASNIGHTVDDRLAALQDYPIDLHQIHMPYGGLSSINSQVREMARLRHAGKIGAVGVSNFSAKQMERASRLLAAEGLALASNQVQLSLLSRKIEHNGVLETARRLGITLIAFSPLASGLLTGKFHGDPERAQALPVLRRTIFRVNAKNLARSARLVEELQGIGDAHGVSAAQVALAWLVNFYGDTVVAIPGASSAKQAAESAAAMDLRLTDREVERLDEMSRATG